MGSSGIDRKRNKELLHAQVAAMEADSQPIVISKPSLGFTARLHPSRLELILHDNMRCRLVSIDLGDPSNEPFFDLLTKDLKSQSLALASIEEAMVRVSCLVKAMTMPMLASLSQGRRESLAIEAQLEELTDSQTKVRSLTGSISGKEGIKVTDEKALAELATVIKEHFGHDRVGITLQTAAFSWNGITDSATRLAVMNWIAEPLLSAPSMAADQPSKGAKALQELLKELLKEEESEWKHFLWSHLKSADLSHLAHLKIGSEGVQDLVELQKRAKLQALIDQLHSLVTPSATSP